MKINELELGDFLGFFIFQSNCIKMISFQGMGGILHNWLPWENDSEWCKGECAWLNEECVQKNSIKRWMYGETKKFNWPSYSNVKTILEEYVFFIFICLEVYVMSFVIKKLHSKFRKKSYRISSGKLGLYFSIFQ